MPLDFKVTLVVPILNEASSLIELLRSIKEQYYPPDEIIFCDAGSADGGPELIKEWWNINGWDTTSLKIILLSGAMPGAGRNAGIRGARNNWIAFLDGGIIPQVDWLQNLCIFARKTHSEVVFGVCHFSGYGSFARAVCALSYGEGSSHPVIPASLFSKAVFEKVGYFPEQLRAAEDIFWVREYLAHYKIRQICQSAKVSYTDFPNNWLKAMRKWQIYEFNCVQAGVRKTQQYAYLFALPAVLYCGFEEKAFALALVFIYFIFRGIIDPIRRSKSKAWWGDSPQAVIIAPLLAMFLDISKLCGITQGMLVNYFRKISLLT